MALPILEIVGPRDRFADYCLWDYAPHADPRGKLRSCSLLWAFLDDFGWPEARELSETLRDVLGPFRTIWGVKRRSDGYSLEFYFYDYGRLQRHISIERVLDAIAPYVEARFPDLARRPYFMFSLELTPSGLASRRLEELTMYIGNPGSVISSGISYKVTRHSVVLDNLYYFFDRRTQCDEVRAKIGCSARADLDARTIDAVLWPELMDCQTIVVGTKKSNDGIYFSRVPHQGLLSFFRRSGISPNMAAFVARHRHGLDHLLYDVGFDHVAVPGGIHIVKSAFYGLL